MVFSIIISIIIIISMAIYSNMNDNGLNWLTMASTMRMTVAWFMRMTKSTTVRMTMAATAMRMTMMSTTMLKCKNANKIDNESHKRDKKQALVMDFWRLKWPLQNQEKPMLLYTHIIHTHIYVYIYCTNSHMGFEPMTSLWAVKQTTIHWAGDRHKLEQTTKKRTVSTVSQNCHFHQIEIHLYLS